jgi:hypothetical protein
MIYASGQLVNLSCTFTVSGIPTDPTTVVGFYRVGTGSAVKYTYGSDPQIVKDVVGVYHFNVTAISAGTYYYRFEGYTACQAADEGSFDCMASRF